MLTLPLWKLNLAEPSGSLLATRRARWAVTTLSLWLIFAHSEAPLRDNCAALPEIKIPPSDGRLAPGIFRIPHPQRPARLRCGRRAPSPRQNDLRLTFLPAIQREKWAVCYLKRYLQLDSKTKLVGWISHLLSLSKQTMFKYNRREKKNLKILFC